LPLLRQCSPRSRSAQLRPAGAFQSDDCFANFPGEPQQQAYACNVTVSQDFQDLKAEGACVPEPILFSGTIGGHNHITAKFAEGNLFITQDEHAFVDATGIGELTGTKYGLHEVGNGTSTQRSTTAQTIASRASGL
jgi:hypothetical protein